MKVVINTDYGGFSLSHAALMRYTELKGIKIYPFTVEDNLEIVPLTDEEASESSFVVYYTNPSPDALKSDDEYYQSFSSKDVKSRCDPDLVRVVEELGSEKASGVYAKLEIVEVKPGTLFRISEYDGMESIEYFEPNKWHIAS